MSEVSLQSAVVASLRNKGLQKRTIWLNANKVNGMIDDISESFGDDFEYIKVNVES